MKPERRITDFLNEVYELPAPVRRRYARVLIHRAVRWFLSHALNVQDVERDLFTADNGKTFPRLDELERDLKKEKKT